MNCYLCGSEEYRVIQEGTRDNPEVNVVECVHCGLVSLSSFDTVGPHRLVRDVTLWAKQTEKDDMRRAEQFNYLTNGKTILDFGCGNGGYLRYAKAYEKYGLEIDDDARAYCKENRQIVFFDLDEDFVFDVITMFHVIEHIKDPIALLAELGNHLNPKGRIIIETPNSDDALITLYDCKDFKEFTYWSKHPFLYNHRTIMAVADKAGFNTRSVQQYQRYPLSNHLYWLSHGKPGGHAIWNFDNNEYAGTLASMGKCDTIIASLEKYED
jgi:SAM-dependent methyltransferase